MSVASWTDVMKVREKVEQKTEASTKTVADIVFENAGKVADQTAVKVHALLTSISCDGAKMER